METARMRDALLAPPPRTEPAVEPRSRLDAAIASAQRRLLSLQEEDGHWCGELQGDTILESEYLLALHVLGRTGEPRARKAGNYLRETQTPGGGWEIFAGGPPDVSSSAKAYFALKLLGDDPGEPHMQRARRTILDLGGLDACNSFTKIYLAVFGQYPWGRCPSVPPELVLLPRGLAFNIYEMSSWSRAILVPLSLVSALKLRCEVPERAAIPELRSARPWTPARPPWARLFFGVDAAVKALERLPSGALRRRAIARAERWILERLEGSDGLGAIFPPIVNTILALRALGYPADHPLIAAQARELQRLEIEEETTLRVQPCFSPVWDTALAINALVESAVPPSDPAIVSGARWLLDRRGHERGDWALGRKRPPRAGWYFEYANPFYPDCDTTSQVLTALSKVAAPADHGSGIRRALFEGHAWHLSMQNRDGGWGAFDRGCDREILTRVPFADHNAMIDPSTADLTARGLESLAEIGFGAEYAPASRAIGFLRRTQEADGSWYGRWGCNYVYGTYLALWGLARIGVGPSDPTVRRGAEWLRSRQNPDGGWGETLASYDDPSLKGRGASTPSQTAWALLGLMAAGQRDGDAVGRGVEFLLGRQAPDGGWPETEWTGTGFPRVFYLRYHLYPLYFPLTALGVYARTGGRPRPRRAASDRPRLAVLATQEGGAV